MKLDEIEIGKKYPCDHKGAQYFATVINNDGRRVLVKLGDIVNEDGDPGDPTESLGTLDSIWVTPEQLHPM